MRGFYKNLGGRKLYLLLAAVVLLATAFIINRYVVSTTSANYYARLIENNIQEKEEDFRELITDTALLLSLVTKTHNETTLEELLEREKGYGFFIYDKDSAAQPSLVFWNTQNALPPLHLPRESNSSRIEWLSNGLYVFSSELVILQNGKTYSVEALIPVMWKYFVEIENLKTEFVGYEDAIKRVDISSSVTDLPVKSSFGNVLFYLEKKLLHESYTNWWSILLVLTGIFFLFLYIHNAAHYINLRFGLWIGVGFLVLFLVALRMITYMFPSMLDLRQFELFDPAIYSSGFIFSSLGDLLINALLFCWIVLFVSRRIDSQAFKVSKLAWVNFFDLAIVIFILVGFTFIFADILQSLVADAQISFNVTNFFSLTQYSFIGFVILATLALSYFFLSQILLTIAGKLTGERSFIILLIAAFIGLLVLTFTQNTAVIELNLYVLIWLLVYLWLMQQRLFSGLNFKLNISEVLFWLFVFSFSMAAVIIFENKKIEFEQRKRFAERLSTQANPSNERMLSIALTYLDNDFLAPNFERFKEREANTNLKDSILKKSFSAYVNIYDTKIYTYDHDQKSLFNIEPISFDTLNTIYRILGKETDIPELRYIEKSFDKFYYVFKREVKDTLGFNIGYFFILSEPKHYKSDGLVPELFKQTKDLGPDYSPGYSYAIYNNLELIAHYHDYAFPTHLNPDEILPTEFHQKTVKDHEELWYRNTADKIVIIAKKDNSFIEAITLFAYLFSTFLFLLAIYRVISLIMRSRFQWSALKQHWQFSIRSQIHSTIIMVSLLSFIVIGIATILFFVNRYNRNNKDRLSGAIQIMVNEVENKLANHNALDDGIMLFDAGANAEVQQLMEDISLIHGTDVNLYDTLGNLRFSSNPFIYNKGVLSEKMHPEAFFRLYDLRQVQTVTEEKMGKVDYISIYSPVRDEKGNAYAYLNIPSYKTQGELKQEISNFLVTIINLNAFIFLVAGAIALFITNRITHSFTIIGQKMRDINLRKINQEIHWKRNDEIGELVIEYNKMVHKLEESAEALAKSEREGAWRQMARQVAHEIKNPLTPMKLSIQYLQKAIDNNSPNVKEMTANVAKTLIEQIDHLSKIAADFSQFANIGNPRNEVFDLHELLYSLTSLYEATENLDFKWEPVPQRVMLFADKTQLNRLFTNLMQNALEAPANKEHRVIRMHEELNGEYITISIKDNGGGIPEHMTDKIFTPNFTTKSSGTGLGLAMSKNIAEHAQGDIWFETLEGEGSTFFVKLPLLRAMN